MSVLRLVGGNLLMAGGQLAISDDCCCEDCTYVFVNCDEYAAAGVRGVAGTQPSVSITLGNVANMDSYEPCTNDCEGCDTYYNDLTIVLAPCTFYTDTTYNQVQCFGGGLAYLEPAPGISASVYAGYCIQTIGTETVAFVIVQVYTGGRGTCETARDGKTFKFRLVVTSPETYLYENCDDPTLTTGFPGQLTGSFVSGWGSYLPTLDPGCTGSVGSGGDPTPVDSDDSRGCDFDAISVSVTLI